MSATDIILEGLQKPQWETVEQQGMTVLDMVKRMKKGHEIVDRDWHKRPAGGQVRINFWIYRETKLSWRWERGSSIMEGTAEQAAVALEKFLNRR